MTGDDCIHEMAPGTCHYCSPRPNAMHLHAASSGWGEVSPYEQEIVDVIAWKGDAFGLVPSDGQIYVFGTGHLIHHRVECWAGVDTPHERLRTYPDASFDTWRHLLDKGAALGIKNIGGGTVLGSRDVCVLRPRHR